jgi:pimeloyl-ACP methyl ester carboxylesterase
MKSYHAARWVFPLLIVYCLAPLQAAELNIQQRPNQAEIELSWPDLGSNKVYTLQQIEDLNRPLWAPLLPWDDWPIQGTTYVDALAGGRSAGFYRLAATERGRVIAVTYQASVTATILNLFIIPGIESQFMIDIPFSATHGVDIYRVDYETLDGLLGPTQASGALFIPSGMAAPADLLSYQHGTIQRREDAPSNPSTQERLVGEVMASDGFVVAMPDLLGLGVGSTGLHPYVHRRSSATAVVDMLRATRNILATDAMIRQDLPQGLSDKLFLFGYSQGGYVTLAAQKEMEEKHAAEFHITASAPSDGPYDLSGTMAEIMTSTNLYPSPNYLPYVLLSYNPIYHLFDDPAEVMIAPYATTLPPLFDGEHTGGEIDAAMPASMVPSEILQPAFLDAFLHDPNDCFRQILRENDLWGWAPATPTRLFHCAADDVVPFANSQVAYDSFIAAGADPSQVMLIDPNPNGVHATCLYSAVPLIIDWFESLR